MRKSTIFCKHYRAMSEHKSCSAGVEYGSFAGLSFEQRPCFARNGEAAPGGCPLAQFPTAEEQAAEEAEMEAHFQLMAKARAAIVAHLGGPWKRGTPGASGRIDCPACDGKETLRFSRAGYNGHIHAKCSSADCVGWIE